MATAISELSQLNQATDTDLFIVSHLSGESYVTRSLSAGNFATAQALQQVQSTASNAYNTANSANENLSSLQNLMPAQASPSNQLADKAFVNSSVQTATANFRGNWETWALVPSVSSDYPEDYAGSKVPTVNDYLVVQDASDLSSIYEGTWRFKYSGTWATDGKNGWMPEYQVNETPMTAAQLAAINSNITSAKVAEYDEALTKFNYELYVPIPQTMTLREDIFPITFTYNNVDYTAQYSDLGTTLIVDNEQTSNNIFLRYISGTTNIVICSASKHTGLFVGVIGVSNLLYNGISPTIGQTQIYDVSGGLVLKNRAINRIDLNANYNNPSLVFPTVTTPAANDFIIQVSAGGSNGINFTPSLTYPNGSFFNDTGEKPVIQKPISTTDTTFTLIYVSYIRVGNYYLLKGMQLKAVSMS